MELYWFKNRSFYKLTWWFEKLKNWILTDLSKHFFKNASEIPLHWISTRSLQNLKQFWHLIDFECNRSKLFYKVEWTLCNKNILLYLNCEKIRILWLHFLSSIQKEYFLKKQHQEINKYFFTSILKHEKHLIQNTL